MLPVSLPPRPLLSLPPNHRYAAGQLIAKKFRLVRPLGKGGMGVVWVAHNETLDVHVAVKVIDLRQVPKPKIVSARVLQEARTAARLGHAAICRVFDFGETEQGDPFVVTELLHGETLASLLKHEPRMVASRAVALLLPIAEGLVGAHGKGIVHRDVKPENVFLSHDDVARLQPKLLDFGIARFVESDQKLTVDGTLLGTPHYMSPEQARGEAAIDARTDVWSFSVLLYELIAGRLPFDGDNYNALLWAISHEEPTSIFELGLGDEALASILARGLKKNANERWETVRAMGEQLAAWLHRQGFREDVAGVSLRTTWLEGTALDPGPEGTLTDVDAQALRARIPTGKMEIAIQSAPEAPARSMGTGVFDRSLPAHASKSPRSRWLIGAGTAALLTGIALGIGLLRSAAPLAPAPHADLEPKQADRVARTDLTLPVLMPTEVSSTPPVPSTPPSAELAKKRAPSTYRSSKSKKIDPERFDLGF